MVQLIKSVTENDGFLATLHTLVLMDDTVILSCSYLDIYVCRRWRRYLGFVMNLEWKLA